MLRKHISSEIIFGFLIANHCYYEAAIKQLVRKYCQDGVVVNSLMNLSTV